MDAKWDIYRPGLQAVLRSTVQADIKFVTGLSDGVETIGDRAILGGLSGLVGSGLNGFRFYGQALSSQVDTRVAGVLQGTKDAAGYVQQGHNQIAVEVEQKMVQAESDGDFSMFLPPET